MAKIKLILPFILQFFINNLFAFSDQQIIHFPSNSEEATLRCDKVIGEFEKSIKKIKEMPNFLAWNFNSSIGFFEKASANFGDQINPITFMGYVSEDKKLRDASSACEEKAGNIFVDIFADKELYKKLKKAKAITKMQKKLFKKLITQFEQNGMALSDEKLKELKTLQEKLNSLQTTFSQNYNNNNLKAVFTKKELQGISKSTLERFEIAGTDKYFVKTKYTEYIQVMENALREETRKKMLELYNNVAAKDNTILLSEAVEIRKKIAAILNYPTWADYKIESRMAQNATKVNEFLLNLRLKLKSGLEKDLKILLTEKKKINAKAKTVEAWDISFLKNQINKSQFKLDSEKIAEYFPASHVLKEMFSIYSTLFSVKFHEIPFEKTWSKGVKLFEIKNLQNDKLIAYFFLDTDPRDGKYGHAAAFPLISGRKFGLKYSTPIAAIVANFTPATATKPSLITHDEVETLFHEFGHIMHQTLTKVKFASLSGTSVAQDFVEAPSQMLENWVWDKNILKKISKHYKNEISLPDDLINKMIENKQFLNSYHYSRQVLLATYDMSIHTSNEPVDVIELYKNLYKDILLIKPLPNDHFPASFGHLMGGYDAGYYGYLWSEVYAQDMFSEFEKAGLENQKLGKKYRSSILELGDSIEALNLVEKFLGRKSNNSAFFKKLGI